ncbi:MAG: lipopolysaccharide heptosyltransferase II [Candidatus Omnitrophota bacterium]|nr:MAG: lipopolysaccharide heptosyltransferase II [Candidatus Omnitrophota bacterium]
MPKIDKSRIKRILAITLSNVGDIILTTPVIEVLLREFPGARLDVMVGPRGKEIFQCHKKLRNLIIYDKKAPFFEKFKLFLKLRSARYDLLVDLRHTILPFVLGARYKTNPFQRAPEEPAHKKDVHLSRLKNLGIDTSNNNFHIPIEETDKRYIDNLLGALKGKPFIVVAPGAKSHVKRWPLKYFAELSDTLKNDLGYEIILTGGENDRIVIERILFYMKTKPVNLLEKTNICQLTYLIGKSKLLITNDSAPMHVGSACGAPTVAFFGPTDEKKYGPLTKAGSKVLRKNIRCSPCEVPQCVNKENRYECLKSISVQEAFRAVKGFLSELFEIPNSTRPHRSDGTCGDRLNGEPQTVQRILLTRTDRIGDVVLSTPAIKAIRDKFPASYIAFMVRPYAKDIVDGNPYLDEVIIYDKYGKQKSLFSTVKFALELRKKKFDRAFMLHPTNRVHLISYLAGIPERIGYDRKSAIFLTKKIPHLKHTGKKHELKYTLDLLSSAGIETRSQELFVPVREKNIEKIEKILAEYHVGKGVFLVAVNPGASSASKRWPAKNFASVCDNLAKKYKARILIVSDNKNAEFAEALAKGMKYEPVNLAGRTTVGELAAMLSKCRLFISNDSGPVHIACAVGVPVISIFGRKNPGLSPKRWGPTGEKSVVFHKDVGCEKCLAEACEAGFKCLEAVTPEEVFKAAEKLLVPFKISRSTCPRKGDGLK